MERLNLKEIVSAVRGSFGYPADAEIENVSTDTRKITENSVFIALKGERFDGHDYAAKAMELGAKAVITQRPVEGAKCIIVDSTAQALLDLAEYFKSKLDLKTVAITGSVGKTTTKDMIFEVVSQRYKTLKTQGNLNNEIGMPQTIFGLDSSFGAAILEMGMSDIGEISRMSMCAHPDVCVVTNIGVSHIENLGSQENILKAKLEILDGAAYDAPIILSADDKYLAKAEISPSHKVYYYSISKKSADVYASNLKSDGKGVDFVINHGGQKYPARVNCLGEHNVKNALAAFCVGLVLEIPPEDIVKGISMFKPEGLRQNITVLKGIRFVVDCYNAAPDSMKAGLSVLSQAKGEGESYAVLADMLELGENSPKYHKTVGEYAAKAGLDYIYCYGENAKFYIEGAVSKGFDSAKAFHFDTLEELGKALKTELKAGDTVLLKGSRGMKLEEVLEEFK